VTLISIEVAALRDDREIIFSQIRLFHSDCGGGKIRIVPSGGFHSLSCSCGMAIRPASSDACVAAIMLVDDRPLRLRTFEGEPYGQTLTRCARYRGRPV